MPKIKTVIFDIGGVLAPDVWESVWLTPKVGLADRLGVSAHHAKAVGIKLYDQFSRGRFPEKAYWAAFAREIGRDIPATLIRAAETATLFRNPHARAVLRKLKARGTRIGIASNNTSFFFPKQMTQGGLLHYIDPDLLFLSHTHGCQKDDPKGLLELVARAVDPGTTLFVDDREGNLQRAQRLGFHTQCYSALDPARTLESGHIMHPPFQKFRLNLNPPRKPRRCVPVPLWRL